MSNLKRFINEEEGMGTVELVLIIVVLVALVLIFKDRIVDFVTGILDAIDEGGEEIKSPT